MNSPPRTHPAEACADCGGTLRGGVCPSCILRLAFDPEEAIPQPAIETATTLGDYELIEVIAHGGMAVVWRARQARLRRVVALKVLRESCLPGEELARRFRIEAEAVSLLRHPHIVTVHEIGESSGRYFLSMELLEGSLAAELRRRTFPPREAACLLGKIAAAVEHAHEHGVLHRDLKPSNILLDAAGEPRVSDFGLARLVEEQEHPTLSGALLGTPAYMAPEQAQGTLGEVTTRSDLYSLGAIFYELLTGRPPFDKTSHLDLLRAVAEDAPDRPSLLRAGLDRDLETICLKCLEKAPAARYGSARELAEDLARWQRGEAIHARPTSTLERMWKWTRRHKSQAALIATALGGALAIVLLSVSFTRQLQREVQRTTAAERAAVNQLATQYGETASQFMRRADWLRALPYLAESCALQNGDPAASRIARIRFEGIIRMAPRLTQLWLPGERMRSIDFDTAYGQLAIFSGAEASIYDINQGTRLAGPLNHGDEVLHGTIADRAKRLLCQTRSKGWFLWEPSSGQLLASGKGVVFSLRSAPSLLDRSLAWRFLVWERNQVRVHSIRDGSQEGESLSFSADVEWAIQSRIPRDTQDQPGHSPFLIATKDGLLHLVDSVTRTALVPPLELGPRSLLRGLDWVKDQYAFEFDEDRGLGLRLLDLGQRKFVATASSRTFTHRVHGWSGSPRRWCVLAREDSGFTLRDVLTDGVLMFARHEAQGYNGAISRDAGLLATAARDGSLRVWYDGGPPTTPSLPIGGRAEQIVLEDSGARLAVASSEPAVRLWQMRENDGAALAGAEGSQLAGVFFAGNALVRVGPDGTFEHRDLAQATEPARRWQTGVTIRSIATDTTGRRVLVTSPEEVSVWDTLKATRLAGPHRMAAGTRSVCLAAHGAVLAILDQTGSCYAGPLSQPARVPILPDARGVFLSPGGEQLIVTAKAATQLWDTGLGSGATLLATLPTADGAVFSPDGRTFALWGLKTSVGNDAVQLFRSENGSPAGTQLDHPGEMTATAFSPDGQLLLTTSRHDARLWSSRSGELVRALRDHPLPPLACGFSPDGAMIWTRTAKELCIWATSSGVIVVPPMPVQSRGSAAWSADGRWLASFDDKQGLRAWDLSPGQRSVPEMRTLARLLSSHRLTADGVLYPLTPQELADARRKVPLP